MAFCREAPGFVDVKHPYDEHMFGGRWVIVGCYNASRYRICENHCLKGFEKIRLSDLINHPPPFGIKRQILLQGSGQRV